MSVATRPGTDLGDADAASECIDAKLARQHADGRLGRVIGGVAAEIVGARDRADVDDVAAVARDHSRHDQSAQVQHGAQIDVDQKVDILGVGFQEGFGPIDAGIVDENVEVRPAW